MQPLTISFWPGLLRQAALLMRVEDGVDRLFLRRIDERAGVDDKHVGIFGVRRDLHAVLQDAAEHDLGIDEVLRAAEADHARLSVRLLPGRDAALRRPRRSQSSKE